MYDGWSEVLAGVGLEHPDSLTTRTLSWLRRRGQIRYIISGRPLTVLSEELTGPPRRVISRPLRNPRAHTPPVCCSSRSWTAGYTARAWREAPRSWLCRGCWRAATKRWIPRSAREGVSSCLGHMTRSGGMWEATGGTPALGLRNRGGVRVGLAWRFVWLPEGGEQTVRGQHRTG